MPFASHSFARSAVRAGVRAYIGTRWFWRSNGAARSLRACRRHARRANARGAGLCPRAPEAQRTLRRARHFALQLRVLRKVSPRGLRSEKYGKDSPMKMIPSETADLLYGRPWRSTRPRTDASLKLDRSGCFWRSFSSGSRATSGCALPPTTPAACTSSTTPIPFQKTSSGSLTPCAPTRISFTTRPAEVDDEKFPCMP